MVRKITIERKEKLAASGVKYFVILNLSENEFNQRVGMRERLSLGEKSTFLSESNQVFALANGDVISIDTAQEENSFFIVAFTSSGRIISERVIVNNQDFDARYSVALKLGIFQNHFEIDKM